MTDATPQSPASAPEPTKPGRGPKRETDYRAGLSPNQLALFEVLEPAVTMFGDGSHRARQLALVLDAKGFAPRLARAA